MFFLTPQVFQNDLSRGSCRADDVVCLVFDEAHKALGNYSYCQVCVGREGHHTPTPLGFNDLQAQILVAEAK